MICPSPRNIRNNVIWYYYDTLWSRWKGRRIEGWAGSGPKWAEVEKYQTREILTEERQKYTIVIFHKILMMPWSILVEEILTSSYTLDYALRLEFPDNTKTINRLLINDSDSPEDSNFKMKLHLTYLTY